MEDRAEPERKRHEAAMFDTLDAFPIVAFLAGRHGFVMHVTQRWYELTGTSEGSSCGDAWFERIESGQRDALRARWFAATAGTEAFEDEAHVRLADGSYRWMMLSVAPSRDPLTGEIVWWFVTLCDVDRKHRLEEERRMFASLAENSNDFIAIASLAGEITFVNAAGRALLDIGTLDDARKSKAESYFMPEDLTYVREVIYPALARDGRWTGDFRFRHFGTHGAISVWYNLFYIRDALTNAPVAIATVSTDTRERTHAERRLRTLVEAGATLTHSLDYAQTLTNLAELVVRSIATFCIIDLVPRSQNGTAIERIVAVHTDRERRDDMARLTAKVPDFKNLAHPVVAAFVDGSSTLIGSVDGDFVERTSLDDEHVRLALALGVRSLVTVPIVANGEILGAMTCVLGEERKPRMNRPQHFDAEDLFFAEELGRRGGAAIENARSYERERRIAVSLQEASLPRTLPRFERLYLTAEYRPGKSEATIGGDWYDAFALEDGRIVLTVGDVLGNGLRAAIVMTKLRQAMQAAAMVVADPNVMLDVADKTLRLHDGDGYATAIAAIYDSKLQTLTFASAGHPGPMLRAPDGSVEELSSPGLLLGLRTGKDRRVKTVPIPPDSVLVFFTDGLTEVTRDVEVGHARVRAALAAVDVRGDANLARSIADTVLRGEDANDDVAVLVARIAPLDEAPAVGAQTTYADGQVLVR
jgi:PAS domain S-box-containing protein